MLVRVAWGVIEAQMVARGVILIIFLLITGGSGAFAKCKAVADGYRVMAYDGRTHEYTIYSTGVIHGMHLTKKIVLMCELYQWDHLLPIKDETACELPVGTFYPRDGLTKEGWSVTVVEQNDWFAIIEGEGEGEGEKKLFQSFKVLSIEILPDNGCR